MQLDTLNIELQTYGENKGKYIGTVSFRDANKTEIKLILSNALAAKFIEFAAPVLMAAADDSTQQFKKKLLAAIEPTKQLL
jgi:hypothetical protein